MLKVATADPFKALVLRAVVPSLKMTFPVGVPPPGETTLMMAVNVTLAPGEHLIQHFRRNQGGSVSGVQGGDEG